MKHILNPEFQYTPSYATDIRRTFAQRRAQLEFERSAHACQSCGADGFCTAGPTCVATSNPRKRCSHCPWPNGCDVRDCGRRDEREDRRGYCDAVARADLVIEDGRIIKDRDGETIQ